MLNISINLKKIKYYNYQSFFAVVVLFNLFFCNIAVRAQANPTKRNFVLSILVAGACQNAIMYDNELDSLCKSKGIAHYYYLIGIEKSELKNYSKQIFGKNINPDQVFSKENYEKLGIRTVNDISRFYIIVNGKVKTSKTFNEIQISDLNFINFENDYLDIKPNKSIEIFNLDSFTLNYSQKLKINKEIRFSNNTQIAKSATVLFLLDPLFNRKLYRISIDSGLISGQIDLNKPIIKYDSILYYFYLKYHFQNPDLMDTLSTYIKLYEHQIKTNFYNIVLEDSSIYISGDISFLEFRRNLKPTLLSHRVIYQFDYNLNFKSFFFDKYLSYSNYFVDFTFLDCFKSDRFQNKLMCFHNQQALVIRTIYSRLDHQIHQIVKHDRDSVIVPIGLPGILYTNYTSHIQNVGNQTPVWLMDPYPYLYFPQDTVLYNFITDKNVASDLKQDSIEYDEEDEYTRNTILSMKKIDNFLLLNYVYEGMTYSIKYDLIEKKRIYKKELGRLPAFNLNTSFDEAGKLYYFPINNSIEENYLYFE